jgi:hypothetical protein
MGYEMSEDNVDYEDYNDLCPDCDDHNTCHKDKIDYDKVYTCKIELWRFKREMKNNERSI